MAEVSGAPDNIESSPNSSVATKPDKNTFEKLNSLADKLGVPGGIDSNLKAATDALLSPEKALDPNADLIKALRLQQKDQGTPNEFKRRTVTPEVLAEIKRFSPEQKNDLEARGFAILELTGESLNDLANDKVLSLDWWMGDLTKMNENRSKEYLYTDFLNEPLSMKSEVAVNRNKFILSGSTNKSFDEQKKMIEKYSQKINKEIPGVKAIMGEPADYIELHADYLSKENKPLITREDNWIITKGKTCEKDKGHMTVGTRFYRSLALRLGDKDDSLRENSLVSIVRKVHKANGDGSHPVAAAPLVVPV